MVGHAYRSFRYTAVQSICYVLKIDTDRAADWIEEAEKCFWESARLSLLNHFTINSQASRKRTPFGPEKKCPIKTGVCL